MRERQAASSAAQRDELRKFIDHATSIISDSTLSDQLATQRASDFLSGLVWLLADSDRETAEQVAA